ncbi:MAG: Glu/Leu/Phe/Val dehydrogenase dimerization domain-containing protein [Dongiaceae bacterium]
MVRQCGLLASAIPERIRIVDDKITGTWGVIVVHSTSLGPALGGCRLRRYADRTEAAADAIRLARGMSFRNAMAGLPFGGGIAVLQEPSCASDRKTLFEAFGRTVDTLGGRYITSEDLGTTIADMQHIRRMTPYVAGLNRSDDRAWDDHSRWTALGVFEAIRYVLERHIGLRLARATIAVQGLKGAGGHLCQMLDGGGAKLLVSDPDAGLQRSVARRYGAKPASMDEILRTKADILAPCASDAVLNADTTKLLEVQAVVGSANNQLATAADGDRLAKQGILYAPDYVVNAGGAVSAAAQYLGEDRESINAHVRGIPFRLRHVLEMARTSGVPTNVAADEMASNILSSGRVDRVR